MISKYTRQLLDTLECELVVMVLNMACCLGVDYGVLFNIESDDQLTTTIQGCGIVIFIEL